ncbi:MAG TPA: GxxExxY protein [Candidatus Phocaeicola excrementigallinarum]|nr:GxxExxY protein [Candidatus Phocaeicola excrementigallinarum]
MENKYNIYNTISREIIGAAIEVHKELGPGLLECVYETCLIRELQRKGLEVKSQVPVPLFYKGEKLDKEFRLDLLVEDKVVVELKAIDEIKDIHEVQLVTYLKLTGKKLGLLINFNVPVLSKGIRRRINGL